MDALAGETGLSRATLYRRTGGREAVLDALAAAGTDVGERAEARERILQAARAVFGRLGFDAATVEEIAAEARVGAVTIYRHFGDKDGLIAAFLEERGFRRAAREASLRPSGDVREDLVRVAERVLASMRDEAPMVRLLFIEGLRRSPLAERVRALSPTRTLTLIASLLASHMEAGRLPRADPEALAKAFSGLLMAFGATGPMLGGWAVADPAATARFITDLFLRGALSPAPGISPAS